MLTAAQIESIKAPPKGQRCYWDDKVAGLGFRVSQGGRRSWVLLYRKNRKGNSRWLTLGTYPPLSLKDAREKAIDALHKVQHDGRDPQAEKQEEKEQLTFAQLADRYLLEYAEHFKRPRSIAQDRRNITKELLPQWGACKARDIEPKDVDALLGAIAARPAPIQANRVHSLISKMFNFAIKIPRLKIETNPAHAVNRPGRESSRERWLSNDEIRRVWAAIEAEPPQTWGAIFKLLMMTGQRPSEVRAMHWDEVDFEESTWTIPGTRTKNDLTHVVPLVGQALDILRSLPQHRDASGYVFPGQRGPVSVPGLGRAVERIRVRSGVAFRTHDLRRTCGTNLGKLGVNRTVIKKVLNHSEGKDITAVYDRHSYDEEKRTALLKWDCRLHEIVEGHDYHDAKVVSLHA
ncbi:MAG: tyrosine-type recombinase/integrase [Candidatus Binataceae bacterium]